MIAGIVVTVVALAGMVVWSLHEIRRVDWVIAARPPSPEADDETSPDEGSG